MYLNRRRFIRTAAAGLATLTTGCLSSSHRRKGDSDSNARDQVDAQYIAIDAFIGRITPKRALEVLPPRAVHFQTHYMEHSREWLEGAVVHFVPVDLIEVLFMYYFPGASRGLLTLARADIFPAAVAELGRRLRLDERCRPMLAQRLKQALFAERNHAIVLQHGKPGIYQEACIIHELHHLWNREHGRRSDDELDAQIWHLRYLAYNGLSLKQALGTFHPNVHDPSDVEVYSSVIERFAEEKGRMHVINWKTFVLPWLDKIPKDGSASEGAEGRSACP